MPSNVASTQLVALSLACLSLAQTTTAVDAAQAAAATIAFPASSPSNAIVVPADFVGFGLETGNFNNYTNIFSQNLINSIGKRMSTPPTIRIGGTTGDHLHYNPNQMENVTCLPYPDCMYGSGAKYIVGPSYFKGFTSFAPNKMSFQAPVNGTINVTNTVDFVTHAYNTLPRNRLAAIAVGNEVGVYDSAQAYVNDAHTLQQAINKALSLSGDDRNIYEVLDLASGQLSNPDKWTLEDAFNDGLDSNGFTKLAAEHYYQIDGSDDFTNADYTPANLQKFLMSHSAITKKFAPYISAINFLKNSSDFKNIPYVLSETGSVLGGPVDFANVLGSCLWSVDFHLYAMSVGVARVDGSQRPTATHALWVPNAIPGYDAPQVRANWYAQPFIADFVSDATTAQSVVEQDLNSDMMSAYAMYSGGKLARIALVNLKLWPNPSGAARGTTTFPVKVPGGTTSVRVRRLHADAGAEALGYDVNLNPKQNITWAGEQWSYTMDNGNGHQIGQVEETVTVTGGVANVMVPDSEAVIVFL